MRHFRRIALLSADGKRVMVKNGFASLKDLRSSLDLVGMEASEPDFPTNVAKSSDEGLADHPHVIDEGLDLRNARLVRHSVRRDLIEPDPGAFAPQGLDLVEQALCFGLAEIHAASFPDEEKRTAAIRG